LLNVAALGAVAAAALRIGGGEARVMGLVTPPTVRPLNHRFRASAEVDAKTSAAQTSPQTVERADAGTRDVEIIGPPSVVG
jgi:hypothetical protein